MPPFANKNTEWLDFRGSWIAYVAVLILFRFFLGMTALSPKISWSIINITHAWVTLYLFHFLRGTMFGEVEDQSGRYDGLTFWEQIDHGYQFTANRKFFTVLPLVLFAFAFHGLHSDDIALLFFNVISTAIVIIAKMPFMHKRRLFGLNKKQIFNMPKMEDSPRRKTSRKND